MEHSGARHSGTGEAVTDHDGVDLSNAGTEHNETKVTKAQLDKVDVSTPLIFPPTDEPTVDWSSIKGVERRTSAELKALGLKNVEQLQKLSAEERLLLQAKLAAKGIDLDWAVFGLTQAGGAESSQAARKPSIADSHREQDLSTDSTTVTTRAATSAATSATTSTTTAAKTSASSQGSLSVGEQVVDWSEIDGVDWRAAAELKSLGIKNVEQVEMMNAKDRAAFESRLAARGIHWNWSLLTTIKESNPSQAETTNSVADISGQSARSDSNFQTVTTTSSCSGKTEIGSSETHSAGSKTTEGNTTGSNFDWNTMEGVDWRTAAELKAKGIKSVDQLQSLSPEDRTQLQNEFNAKGIHWDWEQVSKWKVPNAKTAAARILASSVPLAGLSAASADALNESGATPLRSGQSDSAHPDSATYMGGRSSSDQSSNERSLPEQSFVTEAETNQLPVFSTAVPRVKDDLTLLDGIDGPQAEELHRMGVHNFDQLHDLPEQQRTRLQRWFRQRGWYLDMDQWRIASEGNTQTPSTEDIQRRAFEVYQQRASNGMNGSESTDWDQAEWELRGNPGFSYGVPHHVDDFAAAATGVTQEARDELYRMGLYNFHQVNELVPEARRLLTRWFAGPRFSVDLTIAFGWLSSLKSVPTDRNYGDVFNERPEKIDDLSDINGVGPATERALNRIGIFQFRQIARWSEENIREFAETLELGDRIQRDRWVDQASRLAGMS